MSSRALTVAVPHGSPTSKKGNLSGGLGSNGTSGEGQSHHAHGTNADGTPVQQWHRNSTVVIMAVDEADRAVVKKSPGAVLPQSSSSHLHHDHSLFHMHRNSSLTHSGLHENEFSIDHIDYLTLRFKHPEDSALNAPLKPGMIGKRDSTHGTGRTKIDRTLEGGFLADFFDRYWHRVQKGIITAVIIWGLYFVNDYDKNNAGLRNNYTETVIIRFANCAIGLCCALALSTSFIQKRKLLMPVVGFAMITFGVAQIIFGMWDANELDPAYSVIMILIPSTSSTLFKQRYVFTVAFQAALLLLYILITYSFDSFHSSSDLVLTALGLFFANCLFAIHAYRREYKMRKDYLMKCQLEKEEIRSQNLLLRMLPASVISKLREGSEFIYYKHPSVTLLFSHIHDFDEHVHNMTAMQVIRMLNALFTQFDLLTDIHGVYKVETIGDVYLVAAGCPIEYVRDDHVEAIAAFALDMVAAAKQFMVEHVRDVKSGSVEVLDPNSKHHGYRKKHGMGHVSKLCPIQLQLGINSGTIISGVVGVKYPRFRLMGDTINTSSRMSTTAHADQIQMTTRSWEMLNKNWFVTTYRGEITVKGKGSMKTYLLCSKVDLICPPPKSLEQIQLANGTIKLDAFKTNDDKPARTHGGLLVDPPSPQNPRSSPSLKPSHLHPNDHGSHHHLHQPDLLGHGSEKIGVQRDMTVQNILSPTNVVEMLPTELPGVPEMLQKLRSGEVGEDLESERSTSSISNAHDPERSSTPSSLKHLETGLADVLDENGGDGDIVQVIGADGLSHPEHVIAAGNEGNSPPGATAPTGSPGGAGHRHTKSGTQSGTVQSSGLSAGDASPVTPTIGAGGDPKLQPPSSTKGRRRSTNQAPTSTTATAGMVGSGGPGWLGHGPGMLNMHKTGSVVSSQHASTTLHHSHIDASVTDKEPSASHNSLSTTNTKMIITALDHQSTFKSIRLFSFGPMNAILRPERKWYHLLSQTFITDPMLEFEFLHVYSKDMWSTNRTVVNFMWIFLLPLSMYDIMNNTEIKSNIVLYSWLIRLVGLAVGTWFFYYSKRSVYLKRMQEITVLTVTVIGVVFTWTTGITDALLKSYGVGFVLMLLCLVCMFLGLRFYPALISCTIILGSWVIAAGIFEHTLPGIASLLLAGAIMYLETCWNMENEARHDFVRFRKLYHERMSTHSFLSNMLPPLVFEGLKREDQALVAHERQDADVMFSDIVGFTSIASSLKPEDVVAVLNVMFATFDTLAIKHEVYKVETIGDAYVACTNVVDQRSDHTRCLVEFALAIQRATKSMYTPSHQQIVIRVGIHTGPVIAGVVGRKMPRYHLFGETVTLAELMEQKGVPGMVAFSNAAFTAMPQESLQDYDIKSLDPVPHGASAITRWTIERAARSGHGNITSGDGTQSTAKNRRASMRRPNNPTSSPQGQKTPLQTAVTSPNSQAHSLVLGAQSTVLGVERESESGSGNSGGDSAKNHKDTPPDTAARASIVPISPEGDIFVPIKSSTPLSKAKPAPPQPTPVFLPGAEEATFMPE